MGFAKPKWNSEFKQPKGSKASLKKKEVRAESQKLVQNYLLPVEDVRSLLFQEHPEEHLCFLISSLSNLIATSFWQKSPPKGEEGRSREGNFSHLTHAAVRNQLSLPSNSQFASLPIDFNCHIVLKYLCWFTNLEPEFALFSPLASAATSSKGRIAGSNNHYWTASSQPLQGLVTTR